jgi:hypothetical protein
MEQQLFSIQQASYASGVSECNIRNLINRGWLKIHRLGKRVYLESGEVERLAQRGKR